MALDNPGEAQSLAAQRAKQWLDGLSNRLAACSLLIDQAGKSIEAKKVSRPEELLDSAKLWRAVLDLEQARANISDVIGKLERVTNQSLKKT
jgi:hypothetical protein